MILESVDFWMDEPPAGGPVWSTADCVQHRERERDATDDEGTDGVCVRV